MGPLSGNARLAERRIAGEQLVRNDPDGVLVGLGRLRVSGALFRTHVRRRADGEAGARQLRGVGHLRDPEVGDLHVAVRVDQDVGRLHVPVDDAVVVGVLERRAELQQDSLHDGYGQWRVLADHHVEWSAVDVLHDEEQRIARVPNGVDHDDVGVIESRGRSGLALEPFFHAGVEREVRQHDLDRDPAVQSQVVGEVDDGHAAAADLAADLVLAGGECAELGEELPGALAGEGGRARVGQRRRVWSAARSAEPVFGIDRRSAF